MGLIPAHAGSTRCGVLGLLRRRAHPRSRGEHSITRHTSTFSAGSSPLTRGAPIANLSDYFVFGLIPAHAGSTILPAGEKFARWAHPRSRGEHLILGREFRLRGGSSPLTRGAPNAA